MSDEQNEQDPYRVVLVSLRDDKKIQEELNKLYFDGYAIIEIKPISIDLEPYYHIFASWAPEDFECDHGDDGSNPPIGFSPDE